MRTSATHPLQIDVVEVGRTGGRLGLTFCPGKHQPTALSGAWDRDLDADLDAIADWGASHLLTLVEPQELVGLRVPPEALAQGCAARGITWHHLPIPDTGVPDAACERAWVDGVGPTLRRALRDGGAVVVHCKGGLGRTGLVAGRLLVELGEMDGEAAIDTVRRARDGAITGNVLGTLLGASAIPGEWLDGLELRDVIDAVAVDLVTEMARPGDAGTHEWFERYPAW